MSEEVKQCDNTVKTRCCAFETLNSLLRRRIKVGKVPWYRERTVMNTTLGSLLTVVLLRTAQLNLAKMRVCGYLSGLASPVHYAESCMHGGCLVSSFTCACRAKAHSLWSLASTDKLTMLVSSDAIMST